MNENQNPPEMKTKRVTINELAKVLGEEYLVVSSVIKFLVNLGAVKDVGSVPQPKGQRGKPSRLYELPQVVELQFFTDEEVSSETNVLPESGVELPASENPPVELTPPVSAINSEKEKVDNAANKDNTKIVESAPVAPQ